MLLQLDSTDSSVTLTHDFTIRFPNGIVFDSPHEIALVSADLWYTSYNITADIGNNKFRYYNGSSYVDIIIPDGIYQLSQINTYIQGVMRTNGDWDSVNELYYITISPNLSTIRTRITISDDGITLGYKVDFTALGNGSTLHELLGFTQIELTAAENEGANIVDITRGVNTWNIHCSICKSLKNGAIGDVIWSFVPSSPPGSNIRIEPNSRIYLPLRSNTITDIRMYLTDQRNLPIDIENEPVSYLLHIRPIKDAIQLQK